MLAAAALILAGCADVVFLANQELARTALPAADRADLDHGNLGAIRDRYEAVPPDQLPVTQQALLCDLLLKYQDLGRAETCLDGLGQRIAATPGGAASPIGRALPGKSAQLALALGRPEQAAKLTADATTPGGRYINALARARLGDTAAARTTAEQLRRDFDPAPVFYAASLYAAIGDFPAAREVLEDPSRRLLRDYGLSGHNDMFGGRTGAAVFRLDPFGDYDFGLFGPVILAPAANVYVEFLAAQTYLATGGYQEAERRLDTLLSFPYIGAYRDIQWQVLTDRAELGRRAGDPAASERLLRSAVEVVESVRGSVGGESARIAVIGDRERPYRRLVDQLVRRGEQREALAFTVRAQSRALVELLATRTRFEPSAGATDRLVASYDRAQGEVQLAALETPGDVVTRQARVKILRRKLQDDAPDVADLVTVAPPDLGQLQGRLGAGQAALVYFAGERNWLVFTVTAAQISVIEVPAKDVVPTASALRRAMLHEAGEEWREPAAALYRAAVAPALRNVTASSLVIVPAGALHYVPFAALGEDGSLLIDRVALRVVPNLQLLARPAAHRASQHALVVGDPLQGDPDYGLPFAAAEARQVAAMLPQSTLLIGREATVPRFIELAANHDLIHFAGHGQFDSVRPLESRLVFAAPSGRPAMLTAAQLYQMRTPATLAFLSACETGLGTVAGGNDFIGMQRGFFLAGVQTVVGSLWRVRDDATALLATGFYRAWTGGAPASAALRTAQLAVRAKFSHPSLWSAFFVAEVGPE